MKKGKCEYCGEKFQRLDLHEKFCKSRPAEIETNHNNDLTVNQMIDSIDQQIVELQERRVFLTNLIEFHQGLGRK